MCGIWCMVCGVWCGVCLVVVVTVMVAVVFHPHNRGMPLRRLVREHDLGKAVCLTQLSDSRLRIKQKWPRTLAAKRTAENPTAHWFITNGIPNKNHKDFFIVIKVIF